MDLEWLWLLELQLPVKEKNDSNVWGWGFMLNLPDLWTASETNCDVVFLVMNDNGYGVIKHIQDSMYGGRKFLLI